MRPNYAQDAPPTSISVGGVDYRCKVDYRVWIEVLGKMRQIDPSAQSQENLRLIDEIELLAFGGVLAEEDPLEVLAAVAEFARGYPGLPVQGDAGDMLFSFDWDINAIVIAIRNQSGIDLSYRRTEPFHWWEFLLEFQTLCGDHYILNLMEARSYRGRDRELLRRKRMCALPAEDVDAGRAAAFNAMFEEGETDDADRDED